MNKTIKIVASDYTKFLRVRAAANALAKRADAIKASFGLPEATEKNEGVWIIIDGNETVIGKATVSARAAYQVKAGFSIRIS